MKIVIKLFLELFSRFPWHFIILVTAVLFQAITNAIVVVAVAPITDFLLERTGEQATSITSYFNSIISSFGYQFNLLFVSVFFAVMTLINGIFGVLVLYILLKIKYDVLTHLLTDTMTQFFRSSYSFFSQGEMGTLLNSFQQELTKVGDTFGQIAKIFASSIQGLIFLLVPLSLSPKFTLLFIAVTALFSAPLWLMGRLSYNLGKKNTDTANYYTGLLHELLTGAKLILSYGVQKNSIDLYRESYKKHAKVSVLFQTLRTGLSLLFVPLGTISALFVIYIAFNQGMPFGEVAMVLFAFTRLLPIIGSLLEGKASIQSFVPAYEQVQNLKTEASSLEDIQGSKIFHRFNESIVFKDVKFGYPDKENVLNGINLRIDKGKLTALVGKSGSGKTTAVDLMLGLYNPKSGSILIDGTKLNDYELNSYRKKIGYVPQDPQLFNSSLRENLLWSQPEASEDEIWKACKLANADTFIKEFPDKLEALMGDRGVRLSGGQRQRIALARAIIRKPEILFLDEATSALDSESENLIQESVNQLSGQISIVIIAHRFSTITNSDYVYVLESGKVAEEGTYLDLTSDTQGILYSMLQKQ